MVTQKPRLADPQTRDDYTHTHDIRITPNVHGNLMQTL